MKKAWYRKLKQFERKTVKSKLWSYPDMLLIEPTNRCNIDCIMCFRHYQHTYQIGDMDETVFQTLVPVFPYIQEINLQARGEPLLHKRLLSWIKQAKSYKVKVSFFTHGLMLTPEVIEPLVSFPLDLLTVSLDAATKSQFESIRLRANFDTIINNIRNLNAAKHKANSQYPELHLHFVAMRQNIDELPEVIKLAKELEVTTIIVEHLWVFDVAMIQETLFLDRERMHQVFNLAKETAQKLNINLVLPTEEPIKFCEPAVLKQSGLTQFEYLVQTDTKPDPSTRYYCLEPWRIAIVYWNGDISPCCYTDRVMGNLHQYSFREVWNNEAYRSFRRNLKIGTLPKECVNCRRLQKK
ncbi:MAG: radical SAM/SPASM domain-containing protein [bacterium]